GHGRGHADVDANIARLNLVAEFACGRSTSGEDRGCVAVKTPRQKIERFIHCFGMDQAEHRPKNFGLRELAARRHVFKHGRFNEITLLVIGNLRAATVEQYRRPLGLAPIEGAAVLLDGRSNTAAPSVLPRSISCSMRALLSRVITGPIWLDSSRP